MRVVLLRHGIAIDREHPECPPDPERFLTQEGLQRTRRAVRGLKRLDVRPDVVCTSPWRRARETTDVCLDVLGLERDVVLTRDDLLPGADPVSMAQDLGGLDAECILVVGHAPHLDRLLAHLVGSGELLMSTLKKSGAASIVLEGETSGPTLEWLATPKMLRRLART